MKRINNYQAAAILIIFHILLLNTGFYILMKTFEFPGILRLTADYRLLLFQKNANIIVPAYYLLTLTGFTQIVMSLMMHSIFSSTKSGILIIATVFGILTGVFQSIGFIRWVTIIPFISEMQMHSFISKEYASFIEGCFNAYAGMAIGEHLGFLAQAGWTILLSILMRDSIIFKKWQSNLGIFIGVLTIPMSMESLGGIFTKLNIIVTPVITVWLIWLLSISVLLLKNKD